MSNATRLTNKSALQFAINTINGAPVGEFSAEDVVAKLEGMIAQLDKKNAAPKAQTKTQKANAENIEVVVAFLADNAPTGFTCGDLLKMVPVLEGRSNQYVSAIMKVAIDNGAPIEKYTDKRRTYFRHI